MKQAHTAVKDGKVITIYRKKNNKVRVKVDPFKQTLLTWEAAEKWANEVINATK